MKNFLSVNDIENLPELLKLAAEFKNDPFKSEAFGKRKTIAMLFFNPSLRTRLSTQKAAINLGMEAMVMNVGSEGWQLEFSDGAIMKGDKAEHIKEGAKVISQYCDILAVRSFPTLKDKEKDVAEEVLSGFAKYADVPVISLEGSFEHPLQALADALTIEEYKTKERPKVVLSWAPHVRALPHAVPNSFARMMQKMDVDFVITNPEGYDLPESVRGNVPVLRNQEEAFKDADFIYAKNWSSFDFYGQILSEDATWKISDRQMALTDSAKFMHCLPVRRNVVVDDSVLDGENSIVIEQANNRTFAAQAVIAKLLGYE